jgi:prefoldin subunit 5
MKKNNLTETEPAQTEEMAQAELSHAFSEKQETQPMDIEVSDEIHESSETPGSTEPIPDPLGDETAVDLESEGSNDLEAVPSDERQVTEETTPLEETEAQQPPEPPAPAPASTEPKMITRTAALWLALGGMLVSFILAVVFSLGILAIVNGGLRYARPAQVEGLSSQFASLNAQTASVQREVDNLTVRVNNLEGLDARVAIVEKDAQLLQDDVNAASAALSNLDGQVRDLHGQVAAVGSQIDELNTRTARFQRFLDGLRELLGGVNQP